MADPLGSDSLVKLLGCYNESPQEDFCDTVTDTLILPDTMDLNDAAPNQKKKQPPKFRRLEVFQMETNCPDGVPVLTYAKKSRKLK